MRRVVTIDRGNTRTKTVLFCDEEDSEVRVFEHGQDDLMLKYLTDLQAEGAIFCSVAEPDDSLLERLKSVFKSSFIELNRNTSLPITINYKTPDTLGYDRIAAAVAAYTYFPDACVLVVDAGTAITADLVNEDGLFLGGMISPGVQMRLNALHQFTGRLPQLDARGGSALFPGRDTDSSMRAGCVSGAAFEIYDTYQYAIREYNCNYMVITGGDASLLLPQIMNHDEAYNVFHIELLVALGLYRIYLHNEDI